MAAVEPSTGEPALEKRSLKALTLQSLKRTYDMFAGNYSVKAPVDEGSQRAKIACKIRDEYAAVQTLPAAQPGRAAKAPSVFAPSHAGNGAAALNGAPGAAPPVAESRSTTAKLIESMPEPADRQQRQAQEMALVVQQKKVQKALAVPTAGAPRKKEFSAEIAKRLPSQWPRPKWRAPWKNYRVISGHLGWVRSVAFDPGNEWFCTGSADRTIKIWNSASGQLRLTLTGHIEQVTGLAVSPRHPYMFSCGLDKMVKCWDLETNKVIRHYHGHLSGVYSLALHPTLDVMMTGGRDSVCRVWDMRTKLQVHCLTGHQETVCSILTSRTDPQVITGSHDHTIRTWDLRTGRTQGHLTHHKKSVRGLAMHPGEYAFASAGADNIKKWRLPEGTLTMTAIQNQRTIVNSLAVNEDGLMASGGDNGSLWFWDWNSANCFQRSEAIVQPGSLESEAGIYAMSFDQSGSRLVTCEADKSIKMWKEDENATQAEYPLNFRPPDGRNARRY